MNALATSILVIYAVGAVIAIPVTWIQIGGRSVTIDSDSPIDAGVSVLLAGFLCVFTAMIWPALLAVAAVMFSIAWLIGKAVTR